MLGLAGVQRDFRPGAGNSPCFINILLLKIFYVFLSFLSLSR